MNTSSNSGAGDSSDGETKPEKSVGQRERTPSINPFVALQFHRRPVLRARARSQSADFDHDDESDGPVNGSVCLPSGRFDENGLSLPADVADEYANQRVVRETKMAMNSHLIDTTLGPGGNFRDVDVISLVMLGVPSQHRRAIWLRSSGVELQVHLMHDTFKRVYGLARQKQSVHLPPSVVDQIEKDLTRTIGQTIRRDKKHLIRKMRHVLVARAIYKPAEGYCQALNFFTMSFLILGFSTEEAFWMLNHVADTLFPLSFDAHVTGQCVDGDVIEYYFRSLFPDFDAQLRRLNLDIRMLCVNNFIGTLFCDRMPYESVWCVWDRMFAGGAVEFFNAALKVIALVESQTDRTETDSCVLITKAHRIIRGIVDMPALLNLTKLKHKIRENGLEFRRNTRRLALLREPTRQLRLPSDSSSSSSTDSEALGPLRPSFGAPQF